MIYGRFDPAHKSYVITDPHTPVKWINYIGSLEFGGFVDHTGGALICKGDPGLNRITKYIAQMPAAEFKGETLYLRMHTPAGFRLFSPFYVPCLVPFESYECQVGLGYTRIRSTVEGIETEVTIFVPREENVEIRDVRVSNRRNEAVTLDAVPVVEYTHFDALKQLTNADWVPQTMQSWAVDGGYGRIILCQAAFMRKDTHVNYLTANLAAASFETDRKVFLGDNEYGTWANPVALRRPELSCSEAYRGDNIGALLLPLGTLQPGETKRFVIQLGQEGSLAAALPSIQTYTRVEAVNEAFARLAEFWETYLSRLQVITPDESMNLMLNIHNPYQCYITKTWSRYLSLYQLGYGSRGMGYRDSSQDLMAVNASAPGEVKDFLRKLLQVQKCNGSAMHQFYPLTMQASIGDAGEMEDRPHYYSDDHLWAIQATCAYLKETGDFEFLDEQLPFYEKDKQGNQLETASVLEHLLRAVNFTHADTGAHGLPLLGFADWNDTMNLPTGAESLLCASLYGKALLDLAELSRELGNHDRFAELMVWYEEMRARVQMHGWDGEWFRSYYDADGVPLGSSQNEAGKIYAYAQAWPVIAGFATQQQTERALQAVNDLLDTSNGIKLSAPGFDGYDPTKGGITTYPPGAKENGGIFMHVNPWVMIAETLAGNGERAYHYYAQTNPAAKNDRIDEYECEPYVYAQNILGDEHRQFGLARNSWLSGTASWMYQAATQYILGVRPTYAGLMIDPCIPAAWDGFRVWRQFRRARYDIIIENPGHANQGVAWLEVDGKRVEGNILPLFNDARTHSVVVRMGLAQHG